jgi:hypothetical protein
MDNFNLKKYLREGKLYEEEFDIYTLDEDGEKEIDPQKIKEFLLNNRDKFNTDDFDIILKEYILDLEEVSIEDGYEDSSPQDIINDFIEYGQAAGYNI